MFQSYRRKLRIWETNYGRKAGWIVERHDQPIAMLTDARGEEMFWDSYQLTITTDDDQLRARMLTPIFWLTEGSSLTWRSQAFDEVAPQAFASSVPFTESDRLMMRGLYLSIDPPNPLDQLVLWLRRFL